jgi:hypothetical protein
LYAGLSKGYLQKRLKGTPVAWFISYRHSLRTDEAGVKFVADRVAAIAEGQHLETLGYVVTRIAKSPHPVLPGQH